MRIPSYRPAHIESDSKGTKRGDSYFREPLFAWLEDSNGILWFELQRELASIYYQRIDFVDVAPALLLHFVLDPMERRFCLQVS